MIAFIAYLLTIPAANWMIGNVGTTCIPNGPCLLPVGFGLDAPSGVFMVGLALVLRDIVQRTYGPWVALSAIGLGAVLSAFIAPPALVIASVVAFGLSELLDFAIYTPLAKRRFLVALVVSSMAGAVADSALFLWLAFGSFDHMAGQIVGKFWMIALATAVIAAMKIGRPKGVTP
jgi:uncharacterized PurR-regulated membrane protein YhhQ (DUF165 family)